MSSIAGSDLILPFNINGITDGNIPNLVTITDGLGIGNALNLVSSSYSSALGIVQSSTASGITVYAPNGLAGYPDNLASPAVSVIQPSTTTIGSIMIIDSSLANPVGYVLPSSFNPSSSIDQYLCVPSGQTPVIVSSSWGTQFQVYPMQWRTADSNSLVIPTPFIIPPYSSSNGSPAFSVTDNGYATTADIVKQDSSGGYGIHFRNENSNATGIFIDNANALSNVTAAIKIAANYATALDISNSLSSSNDVINVNNLGTGRSLFISQINNLNTYPLGTFVSQGTNSIIYVSSPTVLAPIPALTAPAILVQHDTRGGMYLTDQFDTTARIPSANLSLLNSKDSACMDIVSNGISSSSPAINIGLNNAGGGVKIQDIGAAQSSSLNSLAYFQGQRDSAAVTHSLQKGNGPNCILQSTLGTAQPSLVLVQSSSIGSLAVIDYNTEVSGGTLGGYLFPTTAGSIGQALVVGSLTTVTLPQFPNLSFSLNKISYTDMAKLSGTPASGAIAMFSTLGDKTITNSGMLAPTTNTSSVNGSLLSLTNKLTGSTAWISNIPTYSGTTVANTIPTWSSSSGNLAVPTSLNGNFLYPMSWSGTGNILGITATGSATPISIDVSAATSPYSMTINTTDGKIYTFPSSLPSPSNGMYLSMLRKGTTNQYDFTWTSSASNGNVVGTGTTTANMVPVFNNTTATALSAPTASTSTTSSYTMSDSGSGFVQSVASTATSSLGGCKITNSGTVTNSTPLKVRIVGASSTTGYNLPNTTPTATQSLVADTTTDSNDGNIKTKWWSPQRVSFLQQVGGTNATTGANDICVLAGITTTNFLTAGAYVGDFKMPIFKTSGCYLTSPGTAVTNFDYSSAYFVQRCPADSTGLAEFSIDIRLVLRAAVVSNQNNFANTCVAISLPISVLEPKNIPCSINGVQFNSTKDYGISQVNMWVFPDKTYSPLAVVLSGNGTMYPGLLQSSQVIPSQSSGGSTFYSTYLGINFTTWGRLYSWAGTAT